MKRNNKNQVNLLKKNKLKLLTYNKPESINGRFFSHIFNTNDFDNMNCIVKIIDNHDSSLLQDFDNKSYQSFEKVNRKRYQDDSDKMELNYEQTLLKASKELNGMNIQFLLPIKTKYGLINKHINMKDKYFNIIDHNIKTNETYLNEYLKTQSEIKAQVTEPIAIVKLLAFREKILNVYRYKIGILSNEILECPEQKSQHFSILLNYMEETTPEVYVTVRKLATISLLEIFQDLLPSYNIRLIDKSTIKLKKETLQLQTYEAFFLKYYKEYLQKLEKMSNSLRQKKRMLYLKEEDFYLGTIAIICMTNLLIDQPYFNFSPNIANCLIPFLDSKYQNIRQLVANCFKEIFKEDKHGELSLSIIRCVYQYIKKQTHFMHVEVISILQSLHIEYRNLSKSTKIQNMSKKLTLRNNFVLNKGKKKKNLQEIKNKILETEKNNRNQFQNFDAIANLLFKIYFYILKRFRNFKILSSCLEGLSKFSQYISSNFQKDLLNILHLLLAKHSLTLKEQLLCVHTSVIISSSEYDTLNTDFTRMYIHLYKILLDMHIGKHNSEMHLLIKILIQVLIYTWKTITQKHLIAFIKRISGVALNCEHNCALVIVYLIKQIVNKSKVINILFDTDSTIGDKIFSPEINDPEYCNAHCSSLWEIVALQRHYHDLLKNVSKNIISTVQIENTTRISVEVLQLTPEKIYSQYDSSNGLFKPTLFIPKILLIKNSYNNKFAEIFNEKNQNANINNSIEKNNFDVFKDLKRRVILK